MQIILVISAPQEQNVTKARESDFKETEENKVISRISPYPPNFSKMAARIIDPATGASTWAFGSHKWNPYIGIFTKKATIDSAHHIVSDFMDFLVAHKSSILGIAREDLDL